jgi:RNA polymerase sigma-70 factor (ECF subfamily)
MAKTVPETSRSDDDLIALIVRRESGGSRAELGPAAREAFDTLYRRHAPLLLAFISSRVPSSDRDDLHQDVWQRVWKHLADQYHGGNFRAWLHQVARRLIIDQVRKRRSEALADVETIPDGRGEVPDDRLIEDERSEALRRCLDKLPDTAAAVVRARLAGEDYSSFCKRLGLKAADAHKLFHRAKNQLKSCVERALG